MTESVNEQILNVETLLNVTRPDGGGYNEHIRGIYNWRDTYNNTNTYYINDVIEYNGSTYIRIIETPGSEVPTDTLCWKTLLGISSSTKVMAFTFRESESKSYIDHNKSTYKLAQKILYPGSNNIGTPSAIHITADINGSGNDTGKVRVVDKTNSGNIICENTTINTTDTTIFDLGTLSNIPTDLSDWELQFSCGDAKIINLYALTILF